MSLDELKGTALYQRKLISTAVELLRPGGTLVYSTCSINPGWCAAAWDWFVSAFVLAARICIQLP